MDKIIADIKKLLEESDPAISVEEFLDPTDPRIEADPVPVVPHDSSPLNWQPR